VAGKGKGKERKKKGSLLRERTGNYIPKRVVRKKGGIQELVRRDFGKREGEH